MTINPQNTKIFLSTAEFEATPAATTENPHPRSPGKPNTFTILEIEPM